MAAVSKTQEAERYIGIGLGVEPSNEDKLGSVTLEKGGKAFRVYTKQLVVVDGPD